MQAALVLIFMLLVFDLCPIQDVLEPDMSSEVKLNFSTSCCIGYAIVFLNEKILRFNFSVSQIILIKLIQRDQSVVVK